MIPPCLSQLYVRAGKACEGADFPCWQTAVERGSAAAAAAPELWCVDSCTKSQFEPLVRAYHSFGSLRIKLLGSLEVRLQLWPIHNVYHALLFLLPFENELIRFNGIQIGDQLCSVCPEPGNSVCLHIVVPVTPPHHELVEKLLHLDVFTFRRSEGRTVQWRQRRLGGGGGFSLAQLAVDHVGEELVEQRETAPLHRELGFGLRTVCLKRQELAHVHLAQVLKESSGDIITAQMRFQTLEVLRISLFAPVAPEYHKAALFGFEPEGIHVICSEHEVAQVADSVFVFVFGLMLTVAPVMRSFSLFMSGRISSPWISSTMMNTLFCCDVLCFSKTSSEGFAVL